MKFYRQMEPVGVHRCIVFRDLMFKIALARWKKPVKITQNVQKVPLLFNILLFWQQIWIPQAKTSGKDPSNVSLAQLERLLCQKTYLVSRTFDIVFFFKMLKRADAYPEWSLVHGYEMHGTKTVFLTYICMVEKKSGSTSPPQTENFFFFKSRAGSEFQHGLWLCLRLALLTNIFGLTTRIYLTPRSGCDQVGEPTLTRTFTKSQLALNCLLCKSEQILKFF